MNNQIERIKHYDDNAINRTRSFFAIQVNIYKEIRFKLKPLNSFCSIITERKGEIPWLCIRKCYQIDKRKCDINNLLLYQNVYSLSVFADKLYLRWKKQASKLASKKKKKLNFIRIINIYAIYFNFGNKQIIVLRSRTLFVKTWTISRYGNAKVKKSRINAKTKK